MPLTFRAKGVSMSTATNWAFNFLVGEMTPILQDVIEWRLYPMHGFFCACSFILGEIILQQTLLRVDLTDVLQFISVRCWVHFWWYYLTTS
jgi:hypothetical protein